MGSIVDRGRTQDATWWSVTSDGKGGDTFSAPSPQKVRWEDTTQEYMSQLDAKEHVSRSIVYLGQNVKAGDYLYQGISVATDPTVVPGAAKVSRFDSIPNLRNLLVQRKAYL